MGPTRSRELPSATDGARARHADVERAFMAVQRTRALVAIASVKLIVRGSVAIVLGMKFGVLGVAFAQPASSAVDLMLQLILWQKAVGTSDARA